MVKKVSANTVRDCWRNGEEIALIDVREEGPYAESHPLFAINVPVSEIEMKLHGLVPRLSAPIIAYDDGELYVYRAVARMKALGYSDVSILEGGLSAYKRVGEVYRDVNVPSKAFGELVESINHTPSLPARDVKDLLERDRDVAILDARRFEEYQTMSIPQGRSCPGGELVYRIFEAVPSPTTTVIVNCAGRTRSILGAQSLINSGIPNRVVALRNGTIGWTLEGLKLETGKTTRIPQPSPGSLEKARQCADYWAAHLDVSIIDENIFKSFRGHAFWEKTTYFLDVRDPEEYALGHLEGFSNAPGGQLVQAADEWIGVRGARIVLYDTDGVRARMAASWLLQMGWDVHVLDDQVTIPKKIQIPLIPSWTPSKPGAISIDDLRSLHGATVVDLARSPEYRKGHIPGAWFASGAELVRDLSSINTGGLIVLTSSDGLVAAANFEATEFPTPQKVVYLAGGTKGWVEAGHPLETESRWLSEPIDVYKRPYEGTSNARKDMQGYLDWEYGLVGQLANDGISGFRVQRDRRAGLP
ncbi:uncharacterized protein N7484_007814 [Penicillium longicatenatum]|uniref:uncharacterized protein n=1 Tax=Penicillium longicatenatum TaxID=1561947 RepID=UPI00254875BF|nr:uncharacterized protein N7484_007814 [Penicillium longicatenatum]KAJ5639952.1 hypothetical protein N7484_007814 [Penicillium longicatenatum]